MSQPAAKIDSDRLRMLLDGVNGFGHNSDTGGYNRTGFSDSDMAVRHWFANEMKGSGLSVTSDAVANLFGRFGPPDGPVVMAGSHLDTVPEGGAFDGALGACVALECVRAIRDAGIDPHTAIEVVATSEEEGRFGGMLGSQTIAGTVSERWLRMAADPSGLPLIEAMRAQGLEAMAALGAAREPGSVRAFLELHIEQGPVLEAASIPIGIAHSVSGVINLSVVLEGSANHSGTTPMELRRDAFAGLAEIATAIPGAIASIGTDQSRVTIGKVDLAPNFPHTIPGRAEFSLIIRDTDREVMTALETRFGEIIDKVGTSRGLAAASETRSWLEPVALDGKLAKMLHGEAETLGLPALAMPSGAGHDAQTMQVLCPSALIFVPSRNGISHAPEEWTDWVDIEKGAQLMLNALVRLAAA